MKNSFNPSVLGVLEKLWGRMMCAHGHEGVPPWLNLPKPDDIFKHLGE